MLRVTAIVPVKDRFDLARIALCAICNQTRQVDELIVVDDGSMVPAESVLTEIIALALSRHISLRFLRHDVAMGVSTARNAGAKAANGEILMFCDSDDFWIPQKVEIILNEMSNYPECTVFLHAFVWIWGTLRIYRLLPQGRTTRIPRWVIYSFGCLSPSCLCIHKDTYGSGFDEDYSYHEDLEFALRLSKKHEIRIFNAPLTLLGRPPMSAGGTTSNARKFREGAIMALRKHTINSPYAWIGLLKILYHSLQIRRGR